MSVLLLLLFLLLLNNLLLLGTDRLAGMNKLVAVQGCLLAALLISLDHLLIGVAILLIKGVGLPLLLRRTHLRIGAPSSVPPHLPYAAAVLAGMIGLVFALWLEKQLPLPQGFFPPFLLATALGTLFCGLLLVIGRASALSQVMGYLVTENGIFLLGTPLMSAGAVWFELTLLLDLFVAVFVMGVAINHISSKFETIDVGRFRSLRD